MYPELKRYYNAHLCFQNKQAGNLKVDLIVEDKVIVEVKALTGDIPKVFEA
jgi:hypothetical protein